jgi:phospholipid transport system substrate-binding protein
MVLLARCGMNYPPADRSHHAALAVVTGAVLVLLVLIPPRAIASPTRDVSATDTVRRHFEAVLALLKSPTFQGLSMDRRREELRYLSERMFGWEAMARRSLGVAWEARAPRERLSFIDGFVRLVERFYLGRLEDADVSHVSNVPIRYVGERAAARETVVQTRLVHRRDLPVNFRMVHRGNRWQAVDVEVDGVSVVDNYRAQFGRVVARDGYAALVELIADRASAPRAEPGTDASP